MRLVLANLLDASQPPVVVKEDGDHQQIFLFTKEGAKFEISSTTDGKGFEVRLIEGPDGRYGSLMLCPRSSNVIRIELLED